MFAFGDVHKTGHLARPPLAAWSCLAFLFLLAFVFCSCEMGSRLTPRKVALMSPWKYFVSFSPLPATAPRVTNGACNQRQPTIKRSQCQPTHANPPPPPARARRQHISAKRHESAAPRDGIRLNGETGSSLSKFLQSKATARGPALGEGGQGGLEDWAGGQFK